MISKYRLHAEGNRGERLSRHARTPHAHEHDQAGPPAARRPGAASGAAAARAWARRPGAAARARSRARAASTRSASRADRCRCSAGCRSAASSRTARGHGRRCACPTSPSCRSTEIDHPGTEGRRARAGRGEDGESDQDRQSSRRPVKLSGLLGNQGRARGDRSRGRQPRLKQRLIRARHGTSLGHVQSGAEERQRNTQT